MWMNTLRPGIDPHQMFLVHQIAKLIHHLVNVAHAAHVVRLLVYTVCRERWRKHAHAYRVVGNMAHGFHAVTKYIDSQASFTKSSR